MPFVRLEKTLSLVDGYRQNFTINGIPILLLVREQTPVAFVNRCPHQGASLTRASLNSHYFICPKHGMKFDIRTGMAENNQCSPLQMIQLEYEGAHIGVWLK